MGTSRNEIREWFERGVRDGATHMIVVCDTFDYEDYPVYVSPGENPNTKAGQYRGQNMQSVMEVYALHLDMETQLAEHRSFNYEMPPGKPVKKAAPKPVPTVYDRLLKDEDE